MPGAGATARIADRPYRPGGFGVRIGTDIPGTGGRPPAPFPIELRVT